jgi:hypothetical protein
MLPVLPSDNLVSIIERSPIIAFDREKDESLEKYFLDASVTRSAESYLEKDVQKEKQSEHLKLIIFKHLLPYHSQSYF